MPRPLKPLKVDEVWVSSVGLKADIFLDRNSKEFFSEVCGLVIHDKTADGCKHKTREALKQSIQIEWKQFIFISREMNTAFLKGEALAFNAWRLEVGQSSPGKWRKRKPFRADGDDPQPPSEFEGDEIDRQRGNPVDGVSYFDGPPVSDKHTVVLPYSKEAWRTVLTIREAVKATRKKIDELTRAENLEALLISGDLGLPLLPEHGESSRDEG